MMMAPRARRDLLDHLLGLVAELILTKGWPGRPMAIALSPCGEEMTIVPMGLRTSGPWHGARWPASVGAGYRRPSPRRYTTHRHRPDRGARALELLAIAEENVARHGLLNGSLRDEGAPASAHRRGIARTR